MPLSNPGIPCPAQLQDVTEQSAASIAAWIKHWLVENLEIASDSLDLNLSLRAYGIESLMGFELIQEMENWLGFSIKLEPTWFSAYSSIQAIALQVAQLHLKHLSSQLTRPVASDLSDLSDLSPIKSSVGVDLFSQCDWFRHIPQTFQTVSAQRDRQVWIEDRWICDFASCNYLGFDLDPQIAQTIPSALQQWGTHPSWTRAVASPAPYVALEQSLATFVDAPDVLVFPSLTLLHLGVIPLLAKGDGVIFVDAAAHRSIYEACRFARQEGAILVQYRHNDLHDLAQKLQRYAHRPTKLIAIDGVYSMTGSPADLPAYARLAKAYAATLYVDDAHGFGILGEQPDSQMPYGYKGNGIVKYFDLDYENDRILYCAGLSKAFSSYGAFMTCTSPLIKAELAQAWTAVFSGPVPVASLASAIAGLQINNQEGDQRRHQIYRLSRKLVMGARAIGFEVDNQQGLPIVSVVIGQEEAMLAACQMLWQHGILVTPALFPAVPRDRSVLRFSVTAANTEAEVAQALKALEAIWQALFCCQTLAS